MIRAALAIVLVLAAAPAHAAEPERCQTLRRQDLAAMFPATIENTRLRRELQRDMAALGCTTAPDTTPAPRRPMRSDDDAVRAIERTRPDGAKCELKRYGGGAVVEVCDR